MAKNFSYDIIRLTRKERLPDSFVTTEVHPIESRSGGCLMVTTLEIDSPWHHAREFGQQIVSTLVREFVRSQSNSNLMKFEHALKLANRTISQAAEKLGVNVSCAAALFIEQEVHFTVIGNCRFLLFRNNALTDVTANDTSQPGQFSSVTSGDLSDREWLMVANKEAVPFLRGQNSATWHEQDTQALCAELIEQAPALERQNYFATLLRFRQDVEGQDQTVFWDDLEHTTPIRLPKFSLPKLNIADQFGRISSKLAQVKNNRKQNKKAQRVSESVAQEIADAEIFEARPRLIDRIPWRKIRLPKVGTRTVVALVVGLAVILIGYRLVAARVQKANDAAPAPTLLEEFTATPVNDRVSFLTSKFSYDRYEDLSSDQQSQFNQGIQDAGLSPLVLKDVTTKVDKEIVAADSLGTTLALIDTTGQLWVVRDGRTIKIEQSLLIQGPRSIALIADQRIVVSDSASNLWLFDGGTTPQPAALTQPASLGSGTKLVGAYNGNLYIYAPDSKTIFRQSAFSNALTSVKSAGKFDPATNALTDLAINGQLIGITEQGAIIGLLSGKVALQAALQLPVATARLSAVEAQPKIAVLSGNFLTIGDKAFTSPVRYFVIAKTTPSDISINSATGALWITSGSEVYSATP